MKGDEVNELMKPEKLASQDDDKSIAFLSTKLHVFNLAFHNFEASFLKAIDPAEARYVLIEASIYYKMDRTKKFLDIGAGPGTKVMLAKVLFDAYGLEIRKSSVYMANRLGIQGVFEADALRFDGYGDYDVLYFYRLFKNDDLQLALEERIFNNMKVGALIAPMHTAMDWDSKAKKMSNYLDLKEQ